MMAYPPLFNSQFMRILLTFQFFTSGLQGLLKSRAFLKSTIYRTDVKSP